jgi:hypothetical protein
VLWSAPAWPSTTSGPVPVGVIGTVLFYHFLTTLDYQGRGFVLRRKSEAGLRKFQAAASSERFRPLPLWLADTHFPCTLGSLNSYGPRVVSMDTGGPGIGITCTEQVAQKAGISVDYDHPVSFLGQMVPSISPDKISLGNAVGRHVPGALSKQQQMAGSAPPYEFKFETIANFTHEFFKQFAVTFDFLGMNLYITAEVPDCRR